MKFSPDKLALVRQPLRASFNISETGDVFAELTACINYLIGNDFEKLIGILYRIDIPENSVSAALEQRAHAHAGAVIAQLIIERQLEKQEMRARFTTPRSDIPDDEKW